MTTPVVVVCVDGFDPDYANAAIDHGCMPAFARMRTEGAYALARTAMPSFTNPNNVSLVTAVAVKDHGICGNYFYDAESGQEVPMTEPQFLRRTTLFEQYAKDGMRVAAITAKDKLRRLIGAGWRGICFSGELAGSTNLKEHGIADVPARMRMRPPHIYSAAISDFVMACGVYLLQHERPDVVYLSLTDYVQHAYAPGEPEADAFLAGLDRRLAQLDSLGAVIVVTGDHGMNAKCKADGSPNVVYIESLLDPVVEGKYRVVLPITDPYVRHHAGLGSYATVYLDAEDLERAKERLGAAEGVEEVLDRKQAAARFDLPGDRIGELVLLGAKDAVFGKRPEFHDLSILSGRRLRSHGGVHESVVPFLVNRRLKPEFAERLTGVRNWDAFEFATKGVIA